MKTKIKTKTIKTKMKNKKKNENKNKNGHEKQNENKNEFSFLFSYRFSFSFVLFLLSKSFCIFVNSTWPWDANLFLEWGGDITYVLLSDWLSYFSSNLSVKQFFPHWRYLWSPRCTILKFKNKNSKKQKHKRK